jgi:hypothetical protein
MGAATSGVPAGNGQIRKGAANLALRVVGVERLIDPRE